MFCYTSVRYIYLTVYNIYEKVKYLYFIGQESKRTDSSGLTAVHSNARLVAYICRVRSLYSSSILVID